MLPCLINATKGEATWTITDFMQGAKIPSINFDSGIRKFEK